jgi:thiamine pyrophosphokinase
MTKSKAYIVGPLLASSDVILPEDDDTIIAVDQGLDRVLEAGLLPDIVVGDFDSVSQSGSVWLDEYSSEVEVVRVEARKDFSDLDLALRVCVERKMDSATLRGFIGGRLDHQIVVLGVCAKHAQNLSITIIDADQQVSFVVAGQTMAIDPRSLFSLIAVEAAARVSIQGAQYPLSNHLLEPLSDLGLSNVADDGCVVTVHEGICFVWVSAQNSA